MSTAVLEQRAAAFGNAPLGVFFLLVAREHRIVAATLARPNIACEVAAAARLNLSPCAKDYQSNRQRALELGPSLRAEARAVLREPEAAAWFAPADLTTQEWLGSNPHDESALASLPVSGRREPTTPSRSWERSTATPADLLTTATKYQAMSSTLAALIYGGGDYGAAMGEPPISRYHVLFHGQPRLYDVDGPAAWHRLCTLYPALDETGVLVPDWSAASGDGDGVHLSLGGLLTTYNVPVTSAAGTSELWSWEFAGIEWMTWEIAAVTRRPPIVSLDEGRTFMVPEALDPPFDPNATNRARLVAVSTDAQPTDADPMGDQDQHMLPFRRTMPARSQEHFRAMTDATRPQPAQSVAEHRAAAPDTVGVAILTMSDTRTKETDVSGGIIKDLLSLTGHTIVAYEVVPDEPERIRAMITAWTTDDRIQAILTNGGTGIASRDTTYDVVAGLIEKRLDGFGEIFRMLSYQEIGAAAMLSRAVAGVYQGRLIFAMPGSRNAVQLAMSKLIAPELAHLVFEVTK